MVSSSSLIYDLFVSHKVLVVSLSLLIYTVHFYSLHHLSIQAHRVRLACWWLLLAGASSRQQPDLDQPNGASSNYVHRIILRLSLDLRKQKRLFSTKIVWFYTHSTFRSGLCSHRFHFACVVEMKSTRKASTLVHRDGLCCCSSAWVLHADLLLAHSAS